MGEDFFMEGGEAVAVEERSGGGFENRGGIAALPWRRDLRRRLCDGGCQRLAVVGFTMSGASS